MFLISETKLVGCYLIKPKVFEDSRGQFIKTFHAEEFSKYGLCSEFPEDFYSVSRKNVIRGLHLAKPPSSHVKTVSCIEGVIFDVLLDMRTDSETFGQYECFELSAVNSEILYIPKGVAHGFCALSESARVYYKVSKQFCAADDVGVLWSSLNIPWPVNDPIVSERDKGFPDFSDYTSSFKLEL